MWDPGKLKAYISSNIPTPNDLTTHESISYCISSKQQHSVIIIVMFDLAVNENEWQLDCAHYSD